VTYEDAGVSGSKGCAQRPGLDAMLKDASRRKFDLVMAWAIDRVGRSLSGAFASFGLRAGHFRLSRHSGLKVTAFEFRAQSAEAQLHAGLAKIRERLK
jgi:hypothetical protein